MTIYLLELDTSHFTFQAFGRDDIEVYKALEDAIEVHCRDYPDADFDFLRDCIPDANLMRVEVPGALRDGEVIV